MIEGYSDHAANERTFLAWVRTGVAVIAFGFVIEKFDLFLPTPLDVSSPRREPPPATATTVVQEIWSMMGERRVMQKVAPRLQP